MDKIIYFIEILKNRIGLVILFCFLILSIFTYQDYGLSWDEPCQQDFGQLGFEKVFEKKINKEYTRQKQYYGVAYEMVLVGFQKVFSIKESSNIYYFRHFFTHLIFLFSTFVFYLILKKTKYKNIAFLGMLFLLLSPRIYAHSFFNPKDIPLLSFTLFSAYFMQKHIYNPRWLTLILIAFFCAFVVNVRVIGVFIPGILLFFYVFQMKELNWKTKIIQVLSFCFLVMFFTILMWPLLWNDTIISFSEALKYFGNFYWNDNVLFNSKTIIAQDLPWYYSLFYIFITTPILYLICFIGGLLISINQFIKKGIDFETVFFLFLFFIPILALIVFKSVVYDGWRHMFYVYPAILFFSIKFIYFLIQKFNRKKVVSIIVIYLLIIVTQIIQLHPFQNIYFNEFISKTELRQKYELDYWGTSFKTGINFVLEDSKAVNIKICTSNQSGEFNTLLLPKTSKERIEFVSSPEDSDYFITNYRFHPEDYTFKDPMFSIKRYNNEILTVFKMN